VLEAPFIRDNLFYFAIIRFGSGLNYYISDLKLNSFQGVEEIGLAYLGYNIQIDENSEFQIKKEVNIFSEIKKIQKYQAYSQGIYGNLTIISETIDGINFSEDKIILNFPNTNNYSINNSFTEISSQYEIDQKPKIKFFPNTKKIPIQLNFEEGIPKFTNISHAEKNLSFSFYLETIIKEKKNKNI